MLAIYLKIGGQIERIVSTRIKEIVMKGYISDCCKKKINIKRSNPNYGYSWSAICSKCNEFCKPIKISIAQRMCHLYKSKFPLDFKAIPPYISIIGS